MGGRNLEESNTHSNAVDAGNLEQLATTANSGRQSGSHTRFFENAIRKTESYASVSFDEISFA